MFRFINRLNSHQLKTVLFPKHRVEKQNIDPSSQRMDMSLPRDTDPPVCPWSSSGPLVQSDVLGTAPRRDVLEASEVDAQATSSQHGGVAARPRCVNSCTEGNPPLMRRWSLLPLCECACNWADVLNRF